MKNKIFPIICMFVLIISVFTNSVFASSYNASNGKSYDLPEFTDEMKKYDKYLIFVENDGKHFALVFLVDDDGYFFNNSSGIYCHGRVLLCSSDGDGYYGSRYEVESGTVARMGVSITGSSTFISSVDIYTDVNKSDVFFSKPLVPVLVGIMDREKAEKMTVQEILGVLPLILVVVVSFLGLRKGLRMLVTFLRRS